MITPIFRMNGEYFGFIKDENLFNLKNIFIGEIILNEVWKQDGTYLGVIYEENYILRNINQEKTNKPLINYPELSSLPEIQPKRFPKDIPNNLLDALEEFSTLV